MFLNRAAKKSEFSVGSGSRPPPSRGSSGDARGASRRPFLGWAWGPDGDEAEASAGVGERLGPEGGIFLEFGRGGGPETLSPSPPRSSSGLEECV